MMRVFLCCLLFLTTTLHSFEGSTDPSKINKPATVKVLLTKLALQAHVEVKGPFLLYNPHDDSWIAHHAKKKKGKMKVGNRGLIWGKPMKGVDEIRIVPNSPQTKLFVNGNEYKGCIEIYSIGGTLNIVNELDVESYLISTLSPQMKTDLNQEAIDAVVITERTSLYSLIGKSAYTSWHLEAEKVGYLGTNQKKESSQVREAVSRTSDLVLHFEKKPFPTSWGQDLAGQSASYRSIFRRKLKAPSGVSRLPSSLDREKSAWKISFTKKELSALLNSSSLSSISLFKAKGTNKVYALRLSTQSGPFNLDFFAFQKALGKKSLPSNDFSVEMGKKGIIFTGYGEGNGVGLCLKSAHRLAEKNEPCPKILQRHFPGAQLVNIRRERGLEKSHSFIWTQAN